MTVLIRFRERTGQVWLEVDYDGLQPPVALFDDMRMIGWSPPVPAPPPVEALDWNRSDPDQGTRYTVLPFRVTGARIDGPRGSGRGGGWSVGERPVHLRMLEGVLNRHASELIAHLPPDATSIGADPEAELAPDPEAAIEPPVDASASPVDPSVDPTGAGGVTIEVLVPLAAAQAARAKLEERGLEVEAEQAVLEVERSYRGNVYVERVPGQRLRILTDERHLDAVADLVAGAAGVSRKDSTRLTVTRPTPPGTPDDRGAASPGLRLVS